MFIFLVVWFDIDIGSMRRTTPKPFKGLNQNGEDSSPLLMLLPIVVLVLMVFLSLLYTGKGDILKGSGSTSLFYAVVATLTFIYIYYVGVKRVLRHKEYFESLYNGISNMVPITIILLLAFLIGDVIEDLGTASYLSSLIKSSNISPALLPLIIFLVSSLISFSTGTKLGNFLYNDANCPISGR